MRDAITQRIPFISYTVYGVPPDIRLSGCVLNFNVSTVPARAILSGERIVASSTGYDPQFMEF